MTTPPSADSPPERPGPLPSPAAAIDPATPAGRGQRILADHRAGADVRDDLNREIEAWRGRQAETAEHAAILAALAQDPDLDAAIAAVCGSRLQTRPLRDLKAQMPPPVIWRGMTEQGQPVPDQWDRDPVLLHGGIALLGGAGGIGKSSVALALGLAAAHAAANNGKSGEACGLRVAALPVLVLSYEDEAEILRERANRIAQATGKADWAETDILQIIETSEALFAPPDAGGRGRPQPTAAWTAVWKKVRETKAALLVVDPLTAAYAGDANADAAGARALLEATRREARATGCGVLFVCHATKNERRASIQRQIDGELAADYIDPGAIAGSAAFYDGARGVIYMERAPSPEQVERARAQGKETELLRIPYDARLVCLKSNYGPAGWYLPLETATDGRDWAGFRAQWEQAAPAPAVVGPGPVAWGPS